MSGKNLKFHFFSWKFWLDVWKKNQKLELVNDMKYAPEKPEIKCLSEKNRQIKIEEF